MLKSPLLFAISVLVSLMSWTGIARAQAAELGLSFALPPATSSTAVQPSPTHTAPTVSPAQPVNPSVVEIAQASSVTEKAPVASITDRELRYAPEVLPPIAPPASTPAQNAPAPKVISQSEAIEAPSQSEKSLHTEAKHQSIELSFSANTIALDAFATVDTSNTAEASGISPAKPVEKQPEKLQHTDTKASRSQDSPSAEAPPTLTTELSLSNAGLTGIEAETAAKPSVEGLQFNGDAVEPGQNPLIVGVDVDSPALLFAQTSLSESDLEQPGSIAFGDLGLGDWIFENGSDSLVARTVGSAEGTRQWSGERTKAYYGHVDPGNGVWNKGTFSYQHGAATPEEADKKQLARLQRQGLQLTEQARKLGLTLTLEEKLNGLDLANQAPLAALARGGYIERLAQARRLQMTGSEAILWARTHAYIDPDTRRWNAPGLGNNVNSISRDQERRMAAISGTMKAFEQGGSESTALAQLQEISLENTGSDVGDRTLQPTANTLDFSDVEVSFGLPPADQALLAALSQPAPSATTEPANNEAPVAATTTTATPEAELQTVATTTSLPEADLDIGIAFSSPEDIDLSTTAPVASAAATTEETDLESVNSTEPEATTAADSEPIGSAAQSASPDELFSIQPNVNTLASNEPSSEQSSAISPEATDSESDSISPKDRLQSLLSGINPARRIAPSEAIPTETDNQPETKTNRGIWRIENKLIDETKPEAE
ncbi:MAG: hypothetical protein AAFU53_05805 [Cyanobacteria bacterium J06632_3]